MNVSKGMQPPSRRTPRLGALAPLVLLAACGGGSDAGGSEDPATSAAPLVITESNAKAVAVDAIDNVNNGAAISAVVTIDDLKAQPVSSQAGILPLARTVRALALRVTQRPGHLTKAATQEVVNCELGGSLAIDSSVASDQGLQAGDRLAITASECVFQEDGDNVTLNGSVSLVVHSGNVDDLSFQIQMGVVLTNFSVSTTTWRTTTTGDVHLAWTATSPSLQSLTASGARFANTFETAGEVDSFTWKNYVQQLEIDGEEVRKRLDAMVESADSHLHASQAVSYQLATTAPVVFHAGDLTGGTLLLTGSQSALRVTFNGIDDVSLQIDGDGDGQFEQTLSTTRSQLYGLP